MSDYIFMLESHLSASQNGVVSEVQAAAAQANVNLFLTGGAVRDMLGGFPVRDLDFTVEGSALRLAKVVAERTRARITAVDEDRESSDLVFPSGVTAEIAAARQERYLKPGGRPVVTPATIREDLLCRDFSINAMALSLNRASLGLLLDPNNGLADLERRELRTINSRVLYDDPSRLLRLVRFRVRFGFTVETRTQQQYESSRAEEMERLVPARRLFEELRAIASEANPADVLVAFEQEKLLHLFSPALAGAKLNLAGLTRLHRIRQLIPFGVELPVNNLAVFLYLLTERLSPSEKSTLIKSTAMHKSEAELPVKAVAAARRLERGLRSSKVSKASQVYQVLHAAPGEEILLLYLISQQRIVQDRIRNYLQKYLPASQEITDDQVSALGFQAGTAKFRKAKEQLIQARLNARARKEAPPAEQAVERETSAPRERENALAHAPMQARAARYRGR